MVDKTQEFLQKLRDSGNWNDEYDYSKVNYVNSKTKVIVIDTKFNTEHLISPYNLLCGIKLGSRNLKNGFLSFEEAREFVRKLNLSKHEDWKKYLNTNNLPHNIPATPNCVYKYNGWIGFEDFIGIKPGFDGTYLSFKEARKFVHSLNLKSQIEWFNYVKTGCKPNNIPRSAYDIYKNDGWISWGDFLGYEIGFDGTYLSFKEARDYAHTLGLQTYSEWEDFCKMGDKPISIPNNPYGVYKNKGWVSTPDWLGTKIGFDGTFLPFKAARNYIHTLNLKSQQEWLCFSKSNNKPNNIPATPDKVYNNDWISMRDWLGNDEMSNFDKHKNFLKFEETKTYVKQLNLKSRLEWQEYVNSGIKPINIPANPESVYKNSGWVSFGDFLGYIGNGEHQWTKKYMLDFIKSLENELVNLDSVELITIINSNNLAKKISQLGSLNDLVSSEAGSQERTNLINDIISRIEGQDESEETLTEDQIPEFEVELTEGNLPSIEEEQDTLEPLDPIQELRLYDNNMITASLDDENMDFLLKNQLKKLWNRVLNNKIDVEQLRNETGGETFTIIKNWFFEEYERVIQIESPSDYIFEYEPNLMQKLITYRLITEKRYGNWSGTGAGKTLSAIFAGRYAGAKNVVIICNNATVEGWCNSIHEYFTHNTVYTKKLLEFTDPKLYTIVDKYNVNFRDGENNYLILNYETFQLGDGDTIVSELLNNNVIDYLILDEVQNVKQRDDDESTRRNVISKLIIHSKEKNEDVLVLAMSATPVINNLTEPKKLIELITGEVHNELETTENIVNGIEMYKALTRHGLRYKPDYGIKVDENFVVVDGQHLVDSIILIPKGAVVDFERILIESKLDAIKDKIKKGTLVYTHYVTELSHVIGTYISNLGFSVGYYTGDDKSGLRPFKEGKIDVLIGSSPIGTGVDGIQKVCNTLIPLVLPWTSAEYDQLVGRVNRQGSNFEKVNIWIPQVEIQLDNGVWSWDRRRHNIITFKATLADLAVDGRVPRHLIPSIPRLVEDARKELVDWVNRLQDGNMITFEREEFKIPLNPQQIERNRNILGDFSGLNQKWSVSRSDNTHDRLSKDPSEWYYYHTLYSEKRKTWSEIPYMEIAKKISGRPDWVVGDFGCGENLLSKEITNKVYAFDHVAIDDTVYACDITNVPIGDGLLDVAVFSLALMGSNYEQYFKEAYRTLKVYGNIFVCEPAAKWEGREEELKKQIESVGFKCFGTVKNTDKFIYIDGLKY